MTYLSQIKIIIKYPFFCFLLGGPTSQHDTIELRGFEDIPEEQVVRGVSKKQPPSQSKVGKSSKYERTEYRFMYLFQLLLYILILCFSIGCGDPETVSVASSPL
jgi:hypothetical protein